MKKIIAATGIAAALMGAAGTASAEVVYMGGVLGLKPNFSTITPLKPADRCGASCKRLYWDNVNVPSGTRAIAKQAAVYGDGPDTWWTFSGSTDSAIEYLTLYGNDHQDTWYLVGSPSVPGNGNTTISWYELPEGDFSNVYFVVNNRDSVAQPRKPLVSLWYHLNGYDNLDLNKPSRVEIDPRTGATILYFDAKPRTTLFTLLFARPSSTTTASSTTLTTSSATPTPEPVSEASASPTPQRVGPIRKLLQRLAAGRSESATVTGRSTPPMASRSAERVSPDSTFSPTSAPRTDSRASVTANPGEVGDEGDNDNGAASVGRRSGEDSPAATRTQRSLDRQAARNDRRAARNTRQLERRVERAERQRSTVSGTGNE